MNITQIIIVIVAVIVIVAILPLWASYLCIFIYFPIFFETQIEILYNFDPLLYRAN